METTNGKRLSTEVLNERRRQAVKLRLSGMYLAAVAETVGLTRGTIISAMKAYKAGGWKAVAVKARGRSVGDGRTLNEEQEKTIRDDLRPNPGSIEVALCAVDPLGGR